MSDLNILDLGKDTPILDLGKAFPKLDKLSAVMEWGMHPVFGANQTKGFDLDLFVYCLDDKGKIHGQEDVIFHNNKVLTGGAITLPEDNRFGGKENVDFSLSAIPKKYQALELYAFLFESDKRNQNFGMMVDAKFTLQDIGNKDTLQRYKLDTFPEATGLHIGTLARVGNGWDFTPKGQPLNVSANRIAGQYI